MEKPQLIQLQEREGQVAGLRALAIGMVVVGAVLLLGVFATVKIANAIPQDFKLNSSNNATEAGETFDAVRGNIFDALEIAGVALIILGLAALIGSFTILGG